MHRCTAKAGLAHTAATDRNAPSADLRKRPAIRSAAKSGFIRVHAEGMAARRELNRA
jgi:hypothetical protein